MGVAIAGVKVSVVAAGSVGAGAVVKVWVEEGSPLTVGVGSEEVVDSAAWEPYED